MRITASHIVNWAETNSKEAQVSLPRLVRRLCYEPGSTRQLAFPAGDSTYTPGWDGQLQSERGNAWIPVGSSCWEIGCDKAVTPKANKEYLKRTSQISFETRMLTTFVFVSPRRWSTKSGWLEVQRHKHEWADVRAFDADDLEQWLEQRPEVALQFAEETGLCGAGVESPERYWKTWAYQCNPAITAEALFVDRIQARDTLIAKIQEAQQQNSGIHLVIRADNEMEAVAFAVACVSGIPELRHSTLIITEQEGWQYVEANRQLQIVVVARSEIATAPTIRNKLLVIVPHAAGDIDSKPAGNEINLPRPNIYEFEKALIAIGVEVSDAKRYAQSSGRSWSIFRRISATNPAIRRPAWMDTAEVSILPCLCLAGAWYDNNAADCLMIQTLIGKPYEEFERDLHTLARVNDAPVLQIGSVWKAKSPLELLYLTGGLITRNQLDRFFELAQQILGSPDPQLELPDSERYAAQMHGKIRPNSDLLIDSLCDTLIKLAARGAELQNLQALNIEQRVGKLIHDLLNAADGERWLSLASYLPALAEAAPEAFLRAVESSLLISDAPVTRLITETGETGAFGRCWHSGLLWALETLAWSSKNFPRVALILARLSHVPIKGNWGNKPMASLLGLFRTWLPQTAADINKRIEVLDRLIRDEPDVAFSLLDGLTQFGHQMATPAAQPKWRDDNAGVGNGVSQNEMWQMTNAARDRLIKCSAGDAQRVAKLIQEIGLRDPLELNNILPLVEIFVSPTVPDVDKEIIRNALRNKLHWHRNYDDTSAEILDDLLEPIESLCQRLAPSDLVTCHRWLFSDHCPKLPVRTRDEDYVVKGGIVTAARLQALNEILEAMSMAGIERMVQECRNPDTVGNTLAEMAWGEEERANWIINHGGLIVLGTPITQCISGLLHSTPAPQSTSLINTVLSKGRAHGWPDETCARLLILARFEPELWEIVDTHGGEMAQTYWGKINPGWSGTKIKTELEFVLNHLLDVNRPRTGLHYCQYALEQVDAKLLFDMLQRFIRGEEPQGALLDSYHLGEMITQLEQSGAIEKMELVKLEFSLFPALRYGQEGSAAALYEAITSEASLFAELISILYKPKNSERDAPVTDETHAAAETAWSLLHHCARQPGTCPDGSIDHEAFSRFIVQVRELCQQADRIDVCDSTLGQILAHAPADEDGLWPFAPARLILDKPEMAEMRNGFHVGTRNKRGMTTRGMLDGGEQERRLASHYRKLAEQLHTTQPYMATLLEEIAQSYEHDGAREDTQANLRKEGY